MKRDILRVDIDRVPATGGQRWQVTIDGQILIDRARDPEHEAARLLLARGLTGRMLTYVGGRPSMILSIEAAAGFTIIEGSATSLRRTKWQPFGASTGQQKAEAA